MIILRVEHNRHRLHRIQVHVCETRFERGRGLLLRQRPDHLSAWLLPRCNAVHTIGLLYPIDVVFCDRRGRILSIRENLGPCRIARHAGASQVWELVAGGVQRWGWQPGDWIRPC